MKGQGRTNETAVATVAAKNYLAHARVLAESFRRLHADVPFYVLLVDEVDGYFDPAKEAFDLLRLGDLKIPDLRAFLARHTLKQAASAAKPYLLDHLLESGFDSAAFLDPDILVCGSLEPLFSLVRSHSVVLTPHLLQPLAGAGGAERELNILQSGVFNAGFVGVSNRQAAREFLAWWRARVLEHCRHGVPEGVYYDQRWLDLAPVFFEDVFILRDPSCNVAHWNLPEREVRVGDDGVVTVDGRPCRFFHFSGFDPDRPHLVTRYNARLDMGSVGPAAGLFRRYLGLLEGAGYRETSRWPYAYEGLRGGENMAREGVASSPASLPGGGLLRAFAARLGRLAPARRASSGASGARRERAADETQSLLSDAPGSVRSPAEDESRRLPFGVNVVGYLTSEKGVGEGARSLSLSLSAAGVPFVLNNYHDPDSSNRVSTLSDFSTDNPYRVSLICVDPGSTPRLVASYGPAFFAGRHNVAYWPWELSDFPRAWKAHFRHLEEVWTPSSFVSQAVAKVSPVPVRTVPYVVSDETPAAHTRADFGLPADKLIFLFIFDFASHFERKNPLGLVRAFRRAFAPRDDVQLVLKCARSRHAPADYAALREEARGLQVRFIDEVLTRAQLVSLINLADGYVSLHRAEGFGLTLAESMCAGKPVIATGYSGNMDFMTADNSFPVSYRLTQLRETVGPYVRGSVWADPDLEHAAELMRRVYERRDLAERVGRQAAEDVRALLHPRAVGARVRSLLEGV